MLQLIRSKIKSKATEILMYAVQKDLVFLANISIFFGADINHIETIGYYKGQPPLVIAVIHDRIELLKLFLKKGANVNYVITAGAYKGITPLMIAAMHDKLDAMKLLLETDADVNYVAATGEYQGTTALIFKVIYDKPNKLAAIKLLLEKGAHINHLAITYSVITESENYDECVSLITNARAVKPILTMLALQRRAKQNNLNAPLKMLPPDGCFKPLKEMLTSHKVTTTAKAKLN